MVEAPRWGVTIMLSSSKRMLLVAGSLAKTSMAAPATLFSFTALASAFSSISPPRAVLMMRTVGLTKSSSLAPISPLVDGVNGIWRVIKSDSLSNCFRGTSSTCRLRAWSTEMKGSWAMSFICSPRARLATSEPTLPSPMIPRVLSLTSVPIKSARRHTPDLSTTLA